MATRYTRRIQVMLRPEQHDRLKQLAVERDTEVSPLVRQMVEDQLGSVEVDPAQSPLDLEWG